MLISSDLNYLANIHCDTSESTPPFKCAVPNCKNSFESWEVHQYSPFKFHNFPKIPIIKAQWKYICGLEADSVITETHKICSDHFTLNDYVRNLKEEFLKPSVKRQLKATAVPSIKVPIVLSVIKDIPLDCIEVGTDNNTSQDIVDLKLTNQDADVEFPELKAEIDKLCSEVVALEAAIKQKQKYLEQKRKRSFRRKADINLYKKQLNSANRTLENRKTLPEKIFSEAQINLLKGKPKVFWSDDDLARAFTLRHRGGKKFYLFMKNELNYPLPSLSCVQAWAGNV